MKSIREQNKSYRIVTKRVGPSTNNTEECEADAKVQSCENMVQGYTLWEID